jgi:uncharacterized protein YkwD
MATVRDDPAAPCGERHRPRGLLLALAAAGLAVLGLVVALAPGRQDAARRVLPASARQLSGQATPRDDLELGAMQRINALRAERGLPELVAAGQLDQVARARSLDMATNHYLSHVAPDGSDVYGLLDAHGYPWLGAGENLYRSTLRDETSIQAAVEFWAGSPQHAANLFNVGYREAGIGVAEGDDGVYFTLVVASR